MIGKIAECQQVYPEQYILPRTPVNLIFMPIYKMLTSNAAPAPMSDNNIQTMKFWDIANGDLNKGRVNGLKDQNARDNS